LHRVLIIDYGSSGNYGDKVVGQVLRQYLALHCPGLLIRNATHVDGADAAGWWYLSPDTEGLFDGVDKAVLFGGSIFFEDALLGRGTWWIDYLKERGIPFLPL